MIPNPCYATASRTPTDLRASGRLNASTFSVAARRLLCSQTTAHQDTSRTGPAGGRKSLFAILGRSALVVNTQGRIGADDQKILACPSRADALCSPQSVAP